jgi:hypothetical protein
VLHNDYWYRKFAFRSAVTAVCLSITLSTAAQNCPDGDVKTHQGGGHRSRATSNLLNGSTLVRQQRSLPEGAGAPQVSPSFLPVVTYNSGGYQPGYVLTADVNGDSHPDLVISNICPASGCGSGLVTVLFGNGDGTFQAAQGYNAGAYGAIATDNVYVGTGGTPEVVVANGYECGSCLDSSVSVLFNNGSGGFPSLEAFPTNAYSAAGVAVADVNGDGVQDVLMVLGGASYSGGPPSLVGVFLGGFDPTTGCYILGPDQTYSTGASGSTSIQVVDVNRDGIPDVIVANQCDIYGNCPPNSVSILLGNGDGTFQQAQLYAVPGFSATSVAVADVNADGAPDLVVSVGSSLDFAQLGTVYVLLGNGDATFQSAQPYDSGGALANSVEIADVNGDGNPDIVVANFCAVSQNSCVGGSMGVVGLLLGNGDGTFQPALTYSSGGLGATAVAVANLNGDTLPDIVVNNRCVDSNCQTGSVGVLLQSTKTTTVLASSANPAIVGEAVTYIATVTNVSNTAVTGTVYFADGNAIVATVNVSGNQASFTTSYAKTGVHQIIATYSGDANDAGSASQTLTEDIVSATGIPVATMTTVTTSGSPAYIGQPVTFTATVTWKYGTVPNGEQVTFYNGSTSLGTAAISNGMAAFTTSSLTAATHTIKATYSGDANFKTSNGTVKQTVSLYPATVVLTASPNPSPYKAPVTLTATVISNAPNPPTGKVDFYNGTTSLGMVTMTGGAAVLSTTKLPLGSDSLTATYEGDSDNAKSTSSAFTQVVNQAALTMTLTSTPNPSALGKKVTFTAIVTSNGGLPSGSGNTVTFSTANATLGTATISSIGVATFSTTTLPIGSDIVTATYAGSADYSSATASITQTVN